MRNSENMARKQLRVLATHRASAGMANIPMPTSRHTVADVTLGARRWTVRIYADGTATVHDRWDPRQREMRACGLRGAIVSAALAAARPAEETEAHG